MAFTLPGSPLGVGWGFLYGYQQVPALNYLPELRQLGAGLTKVYLFWNQIEPQKAQYDWWAVDAFVSQLAAPEEGLIALFSSSVWAAQRPAALLPASPARNLNEYYRFVNDLVRRCGGARGTGRMMQSQTAPSCAANMGGLGSSPSPRTANICR